MGAEKRNGSPGETEPTPVTVTLAGALLRPDATHPGTLLVRVDAPLHSLPAGGGPVLRVREGEVRAGDG